MTRWINAHVPLPGAAARRIGVGLEDVGTPAPMDGIAGATRGRQLWDASPARDRNGSGVDAEAHPGGYLRAEDETILGSYNAN